MTKERRAEIDETLTALRGERWPVAVLAQIIAELLDEIARLQRAGSE